MGARESHASSQGEGGFAGGLCRLGLPGLTKMNWVEASNWPDWKIGNRYCGKSGTRSKGEGVEESMNQNKTIKQLVHFLLSFSLRGEKEGVTG